MTFAVACIVDGIVYAGSHGFDIAGAGGLRRELGAAYLPVLDAAETELREALDEIPGAQLERKHFSVAAHYRNVNENDAIRVAEAVDAVAARHRELRRIDGKKVYELLPDIDWDKGKAALWLLETLELERGNAFPIYIGDDRTDEDAFCALEKRGIGILVSEQPQVTAASYCAEESRRSRVFPARIDRPFARIGRATTAVALLLATPKLSEGGREVEWVRAARFHSEGDARAINSRPICCAGQSGRALERRLLGMRA